MKKLITTLLVGLIGLNPGLAHATEASDQDVKDHAGLMAVIEAMGIPVVFDGEMCKETGWYGGYELHGRDLQLCSRGNKEERMNTMRHESFHVLQDLKDCDIKDKPIAAVFNAEATPGMYKEHAAKYYEDDQVAYEAEAFWAADMFSATTIANLILQKGDECGIKFNF
jgi:hypothetical protein